MSKNECKNKQNLKNKEEGLKILEKKQPTEAKNSKNPSEKTENKKN